jgi:hypothetical protein
MPKMKKSTKCTALLASLVLLSAGVNSIFIATAGGSPSTQPQQVDRQTPMPQQIAAVACAIEAKHCPNVVR